MKKLLFLLPILFVLSGCTSNAEGSEHARLSAISTAKECLQLKGIPVYYSDDAYMLKLQVTCISNQK